jgi:hypothetical protein
MLPSQDVNEYHASLSSWLSLQGENAAEAKFAWKTTIPMCNCLRGFRRGFFWGDESHVWKEEYLAICWVSLQPT